MAEETKKPQETTGPAAEKPKASKLKEVQKPEEGTVVSMAKVDANGGKTGNYMWIEGTGNSKHLPAGKKQEVQRNHGEHLIKKGAAKETTAPPKVQPKAKKAKDEDEEDD